MYKALKQNIVNNLKNIPGRSTNRKIVVIECDDWGGIRVPSRDALDSMASKGLKIIGWFNKFDTLEQKEDLEQLFSVLCSVKDSNDKCAVMTAITNVANPDFDRIRLCGFLEFYYEPFNVTLKRYFPNSNVFESIVQGMEAGIFVPELHGREHINVQLWMKKLRERAHSVMIAFEHGYASLDFVGSTNEAKEFGAEFHFASPDHKPFLVNSIKESVTLFKNIFGYLPRIFVPANGILAPNFETVVDATGIKYLYLNQSIANYSFSRRLKNAPLIDWKNGPGDLSYYTRNCAFEPASPAYKGIEPTINQIASAFRWGKPANISTHRVNFVGGLDPSNRVNGLRELSALLKAIVRRWPEVEFLSSAEMLDYIKKLH